MEERRAVCMQCHNACRVTATVDGDRLVSVEPDLTFPGVKSSLPVTEGCPRRRAAVDYVNHPDRLSYPLRRAGARGEDRWEQVSWDEALDEIAGRLRVLVDRYGPETVATSSGTGRTHDEMRQRFMNLLGSPNHVGAGAICYGPMCAVGHALFGWRVFPVVRQNTACVLLWGGGGPRYWDVFWRAARRARTERGAKIIVVDPRQSDTARDADLHLQVRPGTDCALALGMIHHIIENDLYDHDFVADWCVGLEDLRARAAEYPLEKVAAITWVPAEKIALAAEWYATLGPAATNHGMGIEHLGNVVETLHAHYLLSALCGHLEEPGGDVFPKPFPGIVHEQQVAAHERLSPEQIAKTLGGDRFRLMTRTGYDALQTHVSRVYGNEAYNRTSYEVYAHAPSVYRAMLTGDPYPVRAMITMSSNPMVTEPNTHLVYDALKTLDLYVVVDFFKTPSAQLADYVLPATTYLERPWLWTYSGVVGSERALPKSVPGRYDRRDDYDVWRGLGLRLGQAADWPWENLEDVYDYRLAPAGVTFADFMASGGFLPPPKEDNRYLRTGFATRSGKVELSSSVLAELGYDPLPQFREPAESPYSRPDVAADYPLILITGGRMQPYYHSEHRQVAAFRAKRPDPIAQVHPDTAAPLGIEDGEWIWIETPRGRITQRCRLYEGMDPRVVHVEHGWWFPEEPGAEPSLHGVWKSNCNVLTDDDPEVCNPISGGYPLRGLLCRVVRADEPGRG
jgi:thiosulfate reductase / polysulfide reductase chain A